MIYDVKFEVQDQQSDYSHLRGFQIFNHFPNNSEITTKAGLTKNLYGCTIPDLKVDSFFPRCFDLSDIKQSDELVQNYQETQVLNIIKRLYLYLKR